MRFYWIDFVVAADTAYKAKAFARTRISNVLHLSITDMENAEAGVVVGNGGVGSEVEVANITRYTRSELLPPTRSE